MDDISRGIATAALTLQSVLLQALVHKGALTSEEALDVIDRSLAVSTASLAESDNAAKAAGKNLMRHRVGKQETTRIGNIAFAYSLGLIAVAVLGSPAKAGQFYVGVQGGLVFRDSARLDESLPGTSFAISGDLKFDNPGGGGGISAGYGFANGIRLEGEAGYRRNGVNEFNFSMGSVPLDGHESMWDFMANTYYDIPTGSRWTPYVGGGIGLGILQIAASSAGGSADASGDVFAYQAIAGIGYQLTDRINLGVEYRYFATTDMNFQVQAGPGVLDANTGYDSHNVFVKLRINLD
jgi:OmpA-OmpF porin, OOP family